MHSEDRRQTSPGTLMTTAREFTDCHDEKRLLKKKQQIHQLHIEVREHDHKRRRRKSGTGRHTARETLKAHSKPKQQAVVERMSLDEHPEFRRRERSFRAAVSNTSSSSTASEQKTGERRKNGQKATALPKMRRKTREEAAEEEEEESVRPSTTLGRPKSQTFH